MKIGVTGCSNSSDGYGKPWHYYMGKELNSEIIESSSSGGSNEVNIEKVKYIFDHHPDLDFFVVQLTEPSRFNIPIGEDDRTYISLNTSQPNAIKNMKFYTAIHTGNDARLKEFTNCDVKFDQLFQNCIYTSKFNLNYKVMHTMMAFQYLANHYKKRMIFFSWFVDIKEIIASNGYEQIINEMFILDGYVEKFVIERGIRRLPRDCHYGSEGHEIIYKEFLHPQIKNIINNN